jgi:ABC-2 type transport system permease protein
MPILLIAEREFRTYVATLSFWLSLAVAPLMAGAALVFSGGPPQTLTVSILTSDSQLVHSASLALEEAGRLEGKSFVFAHGGATLLLSQRAPRIFEATFSPGFPLSATGRAMVAHVIERDMARSQTHEAVFAVHQSAVQAAGGADVTRLSGLSTMTMLWLTLTGSLGMLLQAIVRERANRALESLLASAQGWEIVAGKLLGVGAVSLLVLFAWLGSVAAVSAFLPPQAGLIGAVLLALGQPLSLMRDAGIYLCAFAFFGAATLVVGALARDAASAQNLARPVFLVLLVAFFAALATPPGTSSWLLYVPPLTPFLLLVNSGGHVAAMSQAILLGTLLLASVALMMVAARFLSVGTGNYQIFKGRRPETQPLV